MSIWTNGERIRHYVSVCGRVTDAKHNPMPGIQLDIRRATGKPAARAKELRLATTNSEMTEGLRQTVSRPDGTFFFLDCPSGRYVITAVDRQSGVQAEEIVSVQEDAGKKKIKDRGVEEGYQIEIVLQQ